MILKSIKYNPLKGGTYIPTPKKLECKRAIVNIKNKKDNKCFLYSLAAAFVHVNNIYETYQI